MKDEKFIYLLVGLILGILFTWLVTSSAVNRQNFSMMNMMGYRSPQVITRNVDQHFIEQMIPHHEDAITMANIALEKAEHQEIKDLAQSIINSQSKENSQMKAWYKDWFGKEVPEVFFGIGHGMGGMMNNSFDSQLQNAQPFDRAFIQQMIPHHQMAIMMAQMMKTATDRAEMKQLADDIIQAQTEEIEQMKTWYNQWYR